MMQLYKKKKLQIIVEQPFALEVLDIAEHNGARGYTLVPDVSGKGRHGRRGHGDVIDMLDNVLIIIITEEDIAHKILEEMLPFMEDYTGIAYMSDVEVLRDKHY